MTPARIRLRNASSGEAETLGRIGFEAWAASSFAVADGGRVDSAALRTAFARFCADAPARVLVAERDGLPVGWGAREHKDDFVSDLWVAPGAQGGGIGSALIAGLEAAIRKAGYPTARLETLAANEAAIRFYRRHGYEVVWRGERYSDALGYVIDKVGLSKQLTPAPPQAGPTRA